MGRTFKDRHDDHFEKKSIKQLWDEGIEDASNRCANWIKQELDHEIIEKIKLIAHCKHQEFLESSESDDLLDDWCAECGATRRELEV